MISCANHVLYNGKSWKSITPETIRDHLEPYMWTKTRATEENPIQMVEAEPLAQPDTDVIPHTIVSPSSTFEPNVKEDAPLTNANLISAIAPMKPAHILRSQEHSLFWSLFIAVYGYGVYAREQNNKPWNTRIDERVRIMESLKATPRRLKDCNHKLTLDQIQALFSTLMTSPHDSVDQLIVYSIYYSRPIVVMYDCVKAKHVFLPSLASVLDGDDETAIYLLAFSANNRMQYAYLLDRDSIQVRRNYFLLENIKDGGLRAISSYKLGELQSIADQIELDITTTTTKKKKEDLYHAIKLHFKQHFVL
jgi:hypothetical protein